MVWAASSARGSAGAAPLPTPDIFAVIWRSYVASPAERPRSDRRRSRSARPRRSRIGISRRRSAGCDHKKRAILPWTRDGAYTSRGRSSIASTMAVASWSAVNDGAAKLAALTSCSSSPSNIGVSTAGGYTIVKSIGSSRNS